MAVVVAIVGVDDQVEGVPDLEKARASTAERRDDLAISLPRFC